MGYSVALAIHVGCAAVSITFFVVRGCWMLLDHRLLHHPIVRIAPHIIDTALLGAAIWLTIAIHQYPFVSGWLTVKLFALIGYIILGTIALKRGRTRRIRAAAFVAAVLLFSFIASVAWYHNPMGVFSLV